MSRPVEEPTVVVTGIGVLSGPAAGADAFWARLISPSPEKSHRRILDFNPRDWMDRKQAQRTDRFAQVAVAAARMAHLDAGEPGIDPEATGVVLGSGAGASITLREQTAVFLEEGPEAVSHLLGVMGMNNANAAIVAFSLGTRGACYTIGSGCASGTHAVADAARLVRNGSLDVVYAGASEAGLSTDDPRGDLVSAGLLNLRVHTSDGVSRAFGRNRSGFVYAEGAAVMRLERLDSARARGAQIYCAVLGGGNTTDGYDLIAPAPRAEGLTRAMRIALHESGLEPAEVGQVNAHGTGTPNNDLAEAESMVDTFGPTPPPLTSTKPVTGHCGAAAGALEAAATALSIHHRLIPPTAWLDDPDPEIAALVDLVTGAPRPWTPGVAISNSLGLGGQNGSIVLSAVASP